MAQNCEFAEINQQQIIFNISEQHQDVFDNDVKSNLQISINHYLQQKLKLIINTTTIAPKQTQTNVTKTQKLHQQNLAEISINKDQHVNELINLFGAKILTIYSKHKDK